jgi:hypothetical protein
VPSDPDGSESRSGGSGPGNMLVLTGCLLPLLAVLIGAGSLLVHYAIRSPTSPYQVEFKTSGRACDKDRSEDSELVLDQDTGEVLYCSVLPPIGLSDGPRAQGAFSAEEVGRVTSLSQSLASDGGLSEADRNTVRERVAEISRQNGYDKTSPTLLERLTWRVGLFSLIGGLAMLAALGLWAQYLESRTGPAAQ